jgi:hypothetical protein
MSLPLLETDRVFFTMIIAVCQEKSVESSYRFRVIGACKLKLKSWKQIVNGNRR